MLTTLKEALEIEDDFKRECAYAEVIAKLGSVEELEKARAYVQSLKDGLKMQKLYSFIDFQIPLRKIWIPHLGAVDKILHEYPNVAERVLTPGHKVNLLAFAKEVICEVDFAFSVLERLLFDLSRNEKVHYCERWYYPPNSLPWVLEVLTKCQHYGTPQNEIRRVFLPRVIAYTIRDGGWRDFHFSHMEAF